MATFVVLLDADCVVAVTSESNAPKNVVAVTFPVTVTPIFEVANLGEALNPPEPSEVVW